MRRLRYDVSRWHLFLHRQARGLRSPAPTDSPRLQLEDELFEALYSGDRTALDKPDPTRGAWAEQVHAALEATPAYARLASTCRNDALASAAAVESLRDQIETFVPPEAVTPPSPASVRRGASRACGVALQAVEEARETVEGLAGVSFGGGSEPSTAVAGDAGQYAALAQALRHNPQLVKLAKMAGRFRRVLADKRRTRVRHGADELSDVEQGADLARLLPSELGALLHPLRRRILYRNLTERSSLQYALRASQTRGRGPIIVCLDKSDSMSGRRDQWATAVALALLDVANRERRPFALIAFASQVLLERYVPPGTALPHADLFLRCNGGTRIDAALDRALHVVEQDRRLGAADVVLISDGESDDDAEELTARFRQRAEAVEATIFGVAIDFPPESLRLWCDRVVDVTAPGAELPAGVADALAEL